MNTMSDETWIPITGSPEPLDQQIDLHGSYWAEIGPDRGTTWSWSIMLCTDDTGQEDIDSGIVADEDEARQAVADWAEDDLLVAQMTEDLLSEAFSRYGHTDGAVVHAALAVAATSQIAS